MTREFVGVEGGSQVGELRSPLLNAPGFVDAVAASGRAVRNTLSETIACPVLLLWGKYDRLAPLQCAEDMCEQLADSELTVFTASGHTPQIEEPQRFNAAVLGFIGST